MTKRSLAEQLDAAVQWILENPRARLPQDERLTPLARLAAQLCSLPRPEFKRHLKRELGRRKSMSTVAEPVVAAAYPAAAPYLTIENAAKAIEFYKQAFGAVEILRFEDKGWIGHAEIKIGESVIMLSDEFPEYGSVGPNALGGSPVKMHVYVEDVDTFVEHAVASGAKIVQPVADQFYGDRSGRLADPFGYTWMISTRKEVVSPEEMHRRWNAVVGQSQVRKSGVDPIPKGYRTVTPYLVAQDGPALLEFVKQAFDAEEIFRTVGSAGGLHAEAKIGDSMLMMGGGIPGREFRSTPNTHALHIYVEDADAVYQKALAAGATAIDQPRDQEYGERSASVKDPAGNFWYIATHVGKTYIPEGLNNVNPYMHPRRAEPVISFLKRAFGAREIGKYASPDGVVHHAEIRVGSSVVEMGEPQGPYPPLATMYYLYVPDVDRVYQSALAAGATSISPPADQPYGDRSGGVKDAFGNQWYIATHIKDV